MDKRNDFLNSNSRFFDNGFVREIYGNENVSIMNVCERLYIATQYYKDKLGNYSAYMISADNVKKIVEDNEYFPIWLHYMDIEELKKYAMEFNDRTFDVMKDLKKKTDSEGPTQFINYEMEEKIMDKNKSR